MRILPHDSKISCPDLKLLTTEEERLLHVLFSTILFFPQAIWELPILPQFSKDLGKKNGGFSHRHLSSTSASLVIHPGQTKGSSGSSLSCKLTKTVWGGGRRLILLRSWSPPQTASSSRWYFPDQKLQLSFSLMRCLCYSVILIHQIKIPHRATLKM